MGQTTATPIRSTPERATRIDQPTPFPVLRPDPMHESDFLAALRADPSDDLVRLAYADWCDEHGDPKATFVRRSVEASRFHPLDAGWLVAHALAEREFRQHVRPRLDHSILCGPEHHRGLMFYRLTAAEIRRRVPPVPEDALGVVLGDFWKKGPKLVRIPEFTSLPALALTPTKARPQDVQAVLGCSELTNLHSLTVRGMPFEGGVLRTLVDSSAPGPTALRVRDVMPGREELATFRLSDLLRERLTDLSLTDSRERSVLSCLCEPARADNLRRLDFRAEDGFSFGWSSLDASKLLSAWKLPSLEELTIRSLPLTMPQINSLLARFPNLHSLTCDVDREYDVLSVPESLRRLSLTCTGGADDPYNAVYHLAHSPLERLTALQLHVPGNSIDWERLLRAAGEWPDLETLSLSGGQLTRGAFEALGDPSRFRALQRLDLLTVRIELDGSPPMSDDRLPKLRELRFRATHRNKRLRGDCLAFFRLSQLHAYVGEQVLAASDDLTLPELMAYLPVQGTWNRLRPRPEQVPNLALFQLRSLPPVMNLPEEWQADGRHFTLADGDLLRRATDLGPFFLPGPVSDS